MAFTFGKPSFSKIVSDTTGLAEPCYTFIITTKEALSGLCEVEEPLPPVEYLSRHLLVAQPSWLDSFLVEFLKASTKYFAKPYTPEVLKGRLVHSVREKDPLSPYCQVTYTPTHLAIYQGQFTITWSLHQEEGLISIPDEATAGPKKAPAALWVKPPIQFSAGGNVVVSTELDAIPLSDAPSTLLEGRTENTLDKRRVQEAALRAKLALLKAERTHAEYVQKYGQAASDESESDETESETEDSD